MANYIFDQAGNPYSLSPSLADNKTLGLANKLNEKKQRLFPAPNPIIPPPSLVNFDDRGSMDDGTGLLDMAEARIYRGAGNIADTYENIQQNAFGNKDYVLSENTDNLSDEAYSDKKAGYTGRGEYQSDIQNLTESVSTADSLADYLSVAKQGIALAPRALADSAASGLELGVGALATAGATALAGPIGGALTGAAIFGKKVKDAKETVEKVVSLTDRINKGNKAVPSIIAKSAGRTSLLTADITEQMRQEYKAANNGREPSASWYATNVPITMALNAIELGLISKAIPKFSKPAIKDMKEAVKFMSKKHSIEAAKRIFKGITKIVGSAGAEAGQEYLQTWHEILAPVVDADTLESFVTSSANELGKDANQTKSIVGLILGFSAGGTARGVVVAPKVAAGLAVDTVGVTAKAAGKVVEKAGKELNKVKNKASLKILSTEDRKRILNEQEIRQTVADEKISEMEDEINTLDNAKSYEDITSDQRLSSKAKKRQKDLGMTDGDLKDPKKLKVLKDSLIRKYKDDQAVIKTKLMGSNIAKVSKMIGPNVKDLTVEAAEKAVQFAEDVVPEEVVKATIAATITVKEEADKALLAVKNIKSSTAFGIIEIGINGTSDQTRTLVTAAKNLGLGDLRRVISAVEDKNPNLTKNLTKLYNDKKEHLSRLGQNNDNLINADTLSPVIKDIADKGTLGTQSTASAAKAILQALSGKISDKETLVQIQKALKVYKESEGYKDVNTKGRISETSMVVLENRLNNASKRLSREITVDNASKAVKTVVDTAKEVATSIAKVTTEVVDKGVEKVNKIRLERAAEKGPNEVAKVQHKIDKEADAAKKIVQKTKSVAKDTSEVIKQTVSSISDAGQKVLEEGKLNDTLRSAESIIASGPKDAAGLIYSMEHIVKALKKAGYNTIEDLYDLVEQFPGLSKDETFYVALESQFATDVIMQEDKNTGDVKSEPVPENDIESVKKQLIRCKK